MLLLPWFAMQTQPLDSPLSVTSRWLSLALLVLVSLLVGSACVPPVPGDDDDSVGDDDDSTPPPVEFAFWSPDFEDGAMLPEEFECGGDNPELKWEGVPEDAVSLAMVFDDSSFGSYPHWAIFNLSPDSTGLAEGISGYPGTSNDTPDGATELENGGGWDGYFGSCPCGPSPNTYRWRLWALSAELDAPSSGSAASQFAELIEAAEEVSIEMLEMSHQYGPATICR